MNPQSKSFPTAAANGALRGALGLPPQRFGTEELVGMISDEIEQLRAGGKTDDDFTDLLRQTIGVTISSDAIARFMLGSKERRHPS